MAYGHVHFSFAYCNFHAIVTKFYFKRLREMSIVVLEGPVICQVISSINVKKQKIVIILLLICAFFSH